MFFGDEMRIRFSAEERRVGEHGGGDKGTSWRRFVRSGLVAAAAAAAAREEEKVDQKKRGRNQRDETEIRNRL